MSKIPASTFIQFGTTVNGASEVGQFGSYASPDFSGNIGVMQSGTAWARGWFAAVLNTNRQFIQDQNAVDCVFSNYLAYIQQMGIGEYVSSTVYDIYSVVQVAGQFYISLVSPNTGNTPATSPTQWQSGIPGMEVSGVVKVFAGNVAPSGYLLCQGQAVSRTTYAALFTVCGTSFGAGDGLTTFNIPNLQGKIPVGYLSGDPNFGTIGGVGGEETHTLIVNEIPSHSHPITIPSDQTLSSAGTANTVVEAQGFNGNVTLNTGAVGNGSSHNNIQPFVTMNYIIKT